MFESIMNFFKKKEKKEDKLANSKDAAKERLHLVLMQDRANVSVDFLELMKQEIIEVIKKYIDVDENAIDVRLTNKEKEDGTNGAPALYANIPILNIKNETRKIEKEQNAKKEEKRVKEQKEVEDEKSVEKDKKTKQQEINNKEKEEKENETIHTETEEIIEEVIEEAKIIIDEGKAQKQEEEQNSKENNQKQEEKEHEKVTEEKIKSKK